LWYYSNLLEEIAETANYSILFGVTETGGDSKPRTSIRFLKRGKALKLQ
jgi:hypothetical protein